MNQRFCSCPWRKHPQLYAHSEPISNSQLCQLCSSMLESHGRDAVPACTLPYTESLQHLFNFKTLKILELEALKSCHVLHNTLGTRLGDENFVIKCTGVSNPISHSSRIFTQLMRNHILISTDGPKILRLSSFVLLK